MMDFLFPQLGEIFWFSPTAMSERFSIVDGHTEVSGIDSRLYRHYQDRIIGLDDIEAWENIMKRINWIQAYIVYIANQDKREVKVGGHQSKAASMKEILLAAWNVMGPYDYAAAKPHSQSTDIAIQFGLGKLDPDIDIAQKIMGRFRESELPGLDDELLAKVEALPPEDGAIVMGLITPLLSQTEKFKPGDLSIKGIPSYPNPHGPGRESIPMGSVGLGASNTVAMAVLHQYLTKHGYDVPPDRHFWALIGDAETDEGNSLEMLNTALEFEAYNVTHVVDYNRQSLDGNRGMFHYEELKRRYVGWNIIELRWGRKIESEFKQPGGRLFRELLEKLTVAEYQTLLGIGTTETGLRDFRDELLGQLSLKLSGSDNDQIGLRDFLKGTRAEDLYSLFSDLGGHDLTLLSEAMVRSKATTDKPTMILAWTIAGHGLPDMPGRPQNHSQLLTKGQMDRLREDSGIDPENPLALFDPETKEARILREMSARIDSQERANEIQIQSNSAPFARRVPEKFPDRFPLPDLQGWIPTQFGLNQQIESLMRIAETPEADLTSEQKPWKLFADQFVVFSPDVMTSTLPGAAKSVFGKPPSADERRIIDRAREKYKLKFDVGFEQSWEGRHLQPGLAEMKAVNLAGVYAKSSSFTGIPLYAFAVAYDMFLLRRPLDIWFYLQYWHAPVVGVGTPSGAGLAPEGGLHQSVMSLIIALMMPNTIAWEPAFVDELEFILADIMKRRMSGETRNRIITYLRASTVPVYRRDLRIRLAQQKLYQEWVRLNKGPENPVSSKAWEIIRRRWGQDVLRGGYRLIDFRGFSLEDREDYLSNVVKPVSSPRKVYLEPAPYNVSENVVNILASGPAVSQALRASDRLLQGGIFANVIVVTSPSLLVGRLGRLSNSAEPGFSLEHDGEDYRHLRRLIPPEEREFAPIVGVADGSSLHLALAGSRLGVSAGSVDLGIEKNGLSVRSVEEIYQYHRLGWRNIVTEAIELMRKRDGETGSYFRYVRAIERLEQSATSTPVSESLNQELEWLKGRVSDPVVSA